jgi:Zn-finger nucleic acid-binding protein
MNVVESRHCAGCGHELTSPGPPSAAAAWTCPECKLTLDAITLEHGTLLDCSGCGGQFADHELLRALLERRDTLSRAVPAELRPQNPARQRIVYRPCPGCQTLMNRRNFGGTSGIIVDICGPHGTWFDRGELPSVLTYVERGGLERTRHQQAADERTRRVTSATDFPSSEHDSYPPLDLGEAARELLELIVDLIRGHH